MQINMQSLILISLTACSGEETFLVTSGTWIISLYRDYTTIALLTSVGVFQICTGEAM